MRHPKAGNPGISVIKLYLAGNTSYLGELSQPDQEYFCLMSFFPKFRTEYSKKS